MLVAAGVFRPGYILGCAVLCSLAIASCGEPRATWVSDGPTSQELDVIGTISGDSISVSGIVRIAPCRVWLAGRRWGAIVEIDLRTGREKLIGRLPHWPVGTRLERGWEDEIFAWSSGSDVAMRLRATPMTSLSMALPPHPWTDHVVGPMVVYRDTLLALAPLGVEKEIRSPRPWKQAPLVMIVSQNGQLHGTVGWVPDRQGVYLSSAQAQARLGVLGDTIVVASLNDAVITKHVQTDPDVWEPIAQARLPRYFAIPEAWEAVWPVPWLDEASEQVRVYTVPHFSEGSFGSDGTFWAIRNVRVRWNRRDSRLAERVYGMAGRWEVTDQVLELYSSDGNLVNAYRIPGGEGSVSSVHVDEGAEFFLVGSDGAVTVVANPRSMRQPCEGPVWPIVLATVDSPTHRAILGGG